MPLFAIVLAACSILNASMYIPPSFKVEEFDKLVAIMRQHSFATVITHSDGSPFASHLPLLLQPQRGPYGTLVGHMARANPQWQHFANGEEVLVVFQGPHAYISPTWYETEVAVPTWNYVAVHAYGLPKLIEDEAVLEAILQETIDKYESGFPQPWPGDLPADFKRKMLQAIVGFAMPISRLEGKFKLGQNRPPADLIGVHQTLHNSESEDDRKLAEIMAQECDWE